MSIKPLVPYATKIINPFLNSMISAYHEKARNLANCNGEILIALIVSLV